MLLAYKAIKSCIEEGMEFGILVSVTFSDMLRLSHD